ncbi:MAG: carboxypeptidase regulatory-like domain-containing protein [Rhodothermales bacterium]
MKYIIFALLLLTPMIVQAQQATLRGFVAAESDGQQLQGVNVTLTSVQGALTGVVTNGDGLYVISRIPPGRYALRVSFIGFSTVRDTLDLSAGEVLVLNFALEEGSEALGEVLVEAELDNGAANVVAGLQSINAKDLELIPAPDITADLVSYLTTLPGIISTGDRGGQVFVRGGEPSHNLFLLDGINVYQPFHILGFYSAISADVLQQADIYAGGYGNKYSGRASSVIDVQARNGNKREHEKSFSMSPFVNAVRIEGPIIKDRVSFLASVRQSVIDRFASKYIGEELPYKFGDIFGKTHFKFSESHQLSITGLYTYDRGALDNTPARSRNEIRWKNSGVGARYLMLPKNSATVAELLFSVSRLETEFGPRSSPTRVSEISGFNTAVNVTNYVGQSEVTVGAYFRTTELATQLGGLFQNVDSDASRLSKVGFYAEPELYLGNGIRVRPSMSVQFFAQTGFFAEPRLRMMWERGKGTLSAAAGFYHQEYAGLNDRRDATNIFTAWTDAPLGELTKAKHALLGYQLNLGSGIEVSVESYYKWLNNLYISEWSPLPQFTSAIQQASGHVKGLDLRFEIQRPSFYAYVTYGLSSVSYEATQDELAIWFGQETFSFRPAHDRRHQINVVGNTTLGAFNLSVRWNFGSGLPYNQVRGIDRFILQDGDVDVTTENGLPRVIYDEPYGGVLPTYHRLDVSVDREFPFKGGMFTLQAGVINVYDRTNLFSLDLFTLEESSQLPIIPTVGVKILF